MHSLDKFFLNSLSFTSDQLTTLRTIGEYRGKQDLYFKQSPEVLEGLQHIAIIESSESSNRLEGITAPLHRITELINNDTTPKNRSEQEIAGYRDCLHLIHKSSKDIPFSLNVILQLHSWLYRYHTNPGGKWKTANNEITEIH